MMQFEKLANYGIATKSELQTMFQHCAKQNHFIDFPTFCLILLDYAE